MKRSTTLFLFSLLLTVNAWSQTDKHERIRISYQASFGKLPDDNSLNYWANTQDPKDKDLKLPQLIERHRNFMYTLAPNTGKEAIRQAFSDVVGRDATTPEIDLYTRKRITYAEITTELLKWLREREMAGMNEYATVIKSAYRLVYGTSISKANLTSLKALPLKRHLDWVNYFSVVLTGKPLNLNSKRTVLSSYSLQYVKGDYNIVPSTLYTEVNLLPSIANITIQGGDNIGQTKGSIGQNGGTVAPSNTNGIISTDGASMVPKDAKIIADNVTAVISTGGGNVISTGGLN